MLIPSIKRDLDRQVNDIEQLLGAGKASCWEDYKRLCGIIQGLKQAKDAIDIVARKYLDDEDMIDE